MQARDDVIFGIGDDAACLRLPEGYDLLVSTDTLVSGVHFLEEWNAYDIACKAVMVNFSDIAAMGGIPCWITLALTMPSINTAWLDAFSQGLKDSLQEYQVALIGGDTSRGPLSITITVHGLVSKGQAVRRKGASVGDSIFVSGTLGAAALAVLVLENNTISTPDRAVLMDKLHHPIPRIDLAPYLRQYASAAIDISDGLAADLNHICQASQVGACLKQDAIPIHPLIVHYMKDKACDLVLHGGDDYELCFTIPSAKVEAFTKAIVAAQLTCYRIGTIEQALGLRLSTSDNEIRDCSLRGYNHF
jgi:thiamine-monophosphate kinase